MSTDGVGLNTCCLQPAHHHELPVAVLQCPLQQAAGILAAADPRNAVVQHPHRRRHAQVGAQPCLSHGGDILSASSIRR